MTTEEEDKARGCECLSTIETQLTKQLGEGKFDLQLAACTLMDPKAEQWETYGELPPLYYKYKEKGRVRRGHIKFTFCPFCGVKKP